MSGCLALVGSGEYLPGMSEFEESLLREGISQGKSPIYLQLPTAAGQESDDRLEYWKELGKEQASRLGIEQRFLPVFTKEDAFNSNFVKLVENSALMYMSGGDPHYLAEVLSGSPLWDAMFRNWNSGASLAGCSAGAMVMSSTVPNFRFLNRAHVNGLGLLPTINVIPHYDKFFKWIPDGAARIMMQVPPENILIGIDEMTALTRRANQAAWEVVGKSRVHVLKGLPAQQLTAGEFIELPS